MSSSRYAGGKIVPGFPVCRDKSQTGTGLFNSEFPITTIVNFPERTMYAVLVKQLASVDVIRCPLFAVGTRTQNANTVILNTVEIGSSPWVLDITNLRQVRGV